jgi:hypothetical protein
MAGRPTSLTPEVQARIVEAVAAGNTRHDAAEYAGVGRSTFLAWLARGRKKNGRNGRPYRDLLDAVKKAEAGAVVRNVAIIQKAAQKTWQAAAWWLERKNPQDWAGYRHEVRELLKLARQVREKQRDANDPPANPKAAAPG